MDSKRLFVYAGLMVSGLLLWQAWQQEHLSGVVATQSAEISTVAPAIQLPESSQFDSGTIQTRSTPKKPQTGSIKVQTDTLRVRVGLLGGNVDQVKLNHYPLSLKDTRLEAVLDDSPTSVRASQDGLEGPKGPDNTKLGQAVYQSEKQAYVLGSRQSQLQVDLHWHSPEGVKVTKHLSFKRGSYAIKQSYTINNTSAKSWQGRVYHQLKTKEQQGKGMFGMRTYAGNAISSPDDKYEKLTFSALKRENIDRDIRGGWLAAQEHYFIAAWVPEPSEVFHYYSFVGNDDTYTVGMVGQRFSLKPGQKITTKPSVLYAGPEEAQRLDAIAPGTLKLTIDYGSLWVLSAPIFWLLTKVHQAMGNWGWAIVFVTLIIKLVFYRLSESSYRSMAKMRQLQPKLEALKERFGQDKAKLSQETMVLYQKEKINPLGGCLPMIIQIPIFLALYWVLIESVELRQAPFVFWIHDLSVKDPYYILPLLMGVSMLVQQMLNPKPQDPIQAKVMMFLPVMMTGLFISFPAGLVLYWLCNNVLSILQQWLIMRRMGVKQSWMA